MLFLAQLIWRARNGTCSLLADHSDATGNEFTGSQKPGFCEILGNDINLVKNPVFLVLMRKFRNTAPKRDNRPNPRNLLPTNPSTLPALIPPPRPTIHLRNPIHSKNQLSQPPRLLPRPREIQPQLATESL